MSWWFKSWFHFQVSVVDELGIPVKFVGVGEGLDDLQPFDAEAFVDAIFPWDFVVSEFSLSLEFVFCKFLFLLDEFRSQFFTLDGRHFFVDSTLN